MSGSWRLTAKRLEGIRAELAERWPLIGRWFRVARGEVDFDYFGWRSYVDHHGVQGAELAATYEQQIAYYEWRLERRLSELAGDRTGRNVVALWTDSMTYCCRRAAAVARGENPGEWVDQRVRRPDLAAESCAIVDEIFARQDRCDDRDRQLVRAGAA